MLDYMGRTTLHIVIMNSNLNATEFLIEQGVDINMADKFGKSALFYACIYKKHQIVDLLIEKGAELKVYTKDLVQELCEAGLNGDI